MNAVVQVEQHELSVVPSQQTGPLASFMQAVQSGMTVEQLSVLQAVIGMQREWDADAARKAYVDDMAKFKLNPPKIYKTKLVAFSGTEYKHATLGDVTLAVTNELAKFGFSHSWETNQADRLISVTCKITHRLGHYELTTMNSTPDNSGKKNAIQAVASSITYMQRYTLLGACGLAAMDEVDDDGQGGRDVPVDYDSREAVRIWKERADAAISLEALRETRSTANQQFFAVGDTDGWNEFKVYAANKKAALQGASS
jgi:hypothetical protein